MIEVNGNTVDFVEGETVKDLLKRMKYTFPLVVVKINDKVVPRSNFSKTIMEFQLEGNPNSYKNSFEKLK